jgi:beta-lactamase class A
MAKRFTYFIIIGIVIFGAGIGIGYSSRYFFTTNNNNATDNIFEFLNPTVVSDLNKHFIINFKPLKEQLLTIQDKYPQKTYIYFNYLNNAVWVGLHEKDLFTAASTVKVPLAMSIYKAVEERKLKLDDKYTLEDLDLDKEFGELYKVGLDKSFTIEELTKIMLEKSDNTAQHALTEVFKRLGIEDPLTNIYNSMGWELNIIGEVPNYGKINLKTLANMFIALYNSTYINFGYSNKILEYLSQTNFNEGITADLPSDIKISHKIGVFVPDGTFSDCGIVYAPNRNYILCLGSNGADEKSANKFMAEVSKVTYQFVINN